jgi:hypothetical protein
LKRFLRATLVAGLIGASGFGALADPLFYSSVTSNDIDYIRKSDPDALGCVVSKGRARLEMPDKRRNALFGDGVFVFEARYLDGARVELWAHADFGSERKASKTVKAVATAVGRLPAFMRQKLNHVVVHKGDETAFAESESNFFVVYSQNVAKRISTHDLEETVFHESVHATLDQKHAGKSAWKRAQRKDNTFITGYGAEEPQKEDFAETMLLAYTLIKYPGRLPAKVEHAVRERIPNRLAYVAGLLERETNGQRRVKRAEICG